MKIQSKFSDYYDHVVVDYTNNVFYDRKIIYNKDEIIKLNFNIKNSNIHSHLKTNLATYLLCEGFLKIGTKVFPYIKVNTILSNGDIIKYYYDTETFLNFYKLVKEENLFLYYRKKDLDKFFDQKIILNSNYPITDFMEAKKNYYYTKHNVSLIEMQFQNFETEFNSFQIYQEIEMFLNKVNEEKTVIINDDKVLRNSKGFDNFSFKNKTKGLI